MKSYELFGGGYASFRRSDPRIEQRIHAALGAAHSVLNVGAGAGSYEPADRAVTALEPSWQMISQRPPGSAPVVRAEAAAMPIADGAFDATLAVFTIQHWADLEAGLTEMMRVSRRQVIFTFDVTRQRDLWFTADYVPAAADLEERRAPRLEQVLKALGGATVEAVPIPGDCIDGFGAAYWRRPSAYLDPNVRANISSLLQLDPDQVRPGVARLAADLESGRWQRRYGHLLELDSLDLGYHLIVATQAD
ncbi:MAG TPA: methyltransferase domain-containing protein [Acidimicrobiales bacterium]|nr:methyltransferase domain-containing protein [Acidimicrobiales bacterium]